MSCSEISERIKRQLIVRKAFYAAVSALLDLEKELLHSTRPEDLATKLVQAHKLFRDLEDFGTGYGEALTGAITAALLGSSKGDPS